MRLTELLAILILAAAAGGWALLQRWLARVDPGNPGLARECDGSCSHCADPHCSSSGG
jgi:hypothetical protein